MASGHTADLAQALGLGLLEELHVGPGEGGHGGAGALRLTQRVRGLTRWTPVSCWQARFGLEITRHFMYYCYVTIPNKEI